MEAWGGRALLMLRWKRFDARSGGVGENEDTGSLLAVEKAPR
jgi:hypothetical protein